jgi:ribosomal-protein-alanine N-acetyltransferase
MYVARPLDPGTNRRILGFVAASIIFDELHINNIASHPDFQRIGIGRRLLMTALDEGKLRGAKVCVLEVRASNGVAQALYTSLGFHTARRRRDYYRSPIEDALEMVKKL